MKNWLCCLVIGVHLGALLARAGEPKSEFQLGMVTHSYDYKELVPLPLKSTEKGIFYGVAAGYESQTSNGFYLRGATDLSFATTDYDGSTQTGEPRLSTTKNALFNIEGNLGFNLLNNSALTDFILYSGAGFHFWNRGLQGAGGFTENYRWFYVPVGAKFSQQLSYAVSIGVNATVKVPFGGHIDVKLSEVSPALDDIGLPLGSKIGYRVEVPLQYRASDSLSFALAPYYEYVGIGQGDARPITSQGRVVRNSSGSTLSAREPESDNHIFGAQLSIGFQSL